MNHVTKLIILPSTDWWLSWSARKFISTWNVTDNQLNWEMFHPCLYLHHQHACKGTVFYCLVMYSTVAVFPLITITCGPSDSLRSHEGWEEQPSFPGLGCTDVPYSSTTNLKILTVVGGILSRSWCICEH